MSLRYNGVRMRFLRHDERLIQSNEMEMPLVLEADAQKDRFSLQRFLTENSDKIYEDLAKYGAVLLRGFDINSEHDFEKTILSIRGFKGISDAFMSEDGRIPVDTLKYVLHTNAVYKTGGTLYLGGFHSENYYSPDVPSFICFCCLRPSLYGGETGLINMEKVYRPLDRRLKNSLEEKPYFVRQWLFSEIQNRYRISSEHLEQLCASFNIPVIGTGKHRCILMYKPSVFLHPVTKKKALQINLFELPRVNRAMRKHFMTDYKDEQWFWHRFVWKLPPAIFKSLEAMYLMVALFFYSPKHALDNAHFKASMLKARSKNYHSLPDQTPVDACFTDDDIEQLAVELRKNYCSCLWQKGDILIVDNKQVIHAGMPGAGPRLVRAMIGNPLKMRYDLNQTGVFTCEERQTESLGHYVTAAANPVKETLAKT